MDIRCIGLPIVVSVYPDRGANRWWTKSWFGNEKKGKRAVQITLMDAIEFINEVVRADSNLRKNEWLEKYYPKDMETLRNIYNQQKEMMMQMKQQQNV